MTVQNMMNFSLEALSIVICVIILLQTITVRSRDNSDRWFKRALIFQIIMLLGDMSGWGLSGSTISGARPVMTAGMTICYIAAELVMLSFFVYVYSFLNEKLPQPGALIKVSVAIVVVQTILTLSSLKLGIFFSITEENIYVRGSLFFLYQLLSVVTLVMLLVLYIRTWKMLTSKEKVYLILYLLLPAAAEVMQAVTHQFASLPVAMTLVFLLVCMFINSEMNQQLEASDLVIQSNQETLTNETILALSSAVEAKDRFTNGHSERVAQYAKEIARRLGWNEEDQKKIYYTGLLHDVGKIRVPDSIINKEGKLSDMEFEKMRLHPTAGYYILKQISSVRDFAFGARWHHERWDGKGYPNGLKGENIPLIARILSVADAYDAMTSSRSFRPPMPQEKVREEIRKGAGSQFDPKIAAIALTMIDEDHDYQLRQPGNLDWVILAIDDDFVHIHKQLEMILDWNPQYHLKLAASGKRGIDFLKKEKADLVLLDMEMPGMDGLEVLQWIRKNCGNLPVIAMTESGDFSIIQKMEELGISDYLTKPLVPQTVTDSVQSTLLNGDFLLK